MSKYQLGLEKVENKNSIQYISHKKLGFTLAEVLITLVVIGIVAVLTLPAMIQSYKKHIVEVKLKKFYTLMQEVVKLSEIENGDKKEWIVYDSTHSVYDFYSKYLAKYLNVAKVEVENNESIVVYLADGTAIWFYTSEGQNVQTMHCAFYPKGKDYKSEGKRKAGRNKFFFHWSAGQKGRAYYCQSPYLNGYDKGFEPYLYWDNGYWDAEKGCRQLAIPDDPNEFRDVLMNQATYGCALSGMYCTELIRRNGWKIPDDYPFKF